MSGKFENIKETKKDYITVEFLYNELKSKFKLEKITPEDIDPDIKISEKDINRPGLALAGYLKLFTFDRIQIMGNTEMKYLEHLSPEGRQKSLEGFFSFKVPCVIVTDNNEIPSELLNIASKNNIPLFRTVYPTTRFSFFISDFLDDQFSKQVLLHGSFVDVYGVGLLFSGKSGIGKSEIALDLIERGHRLVTDDLVAVSKKGESVLMGSGLALSKHMMEIRGLGLVDVATIFGIRSIRYQKRVEVIVELEDWDKNKAYERIGLDNSTLNILDVDIEHIKLPIFPGKNITVIAEVIALNYLCKHYGYNAAATFREKLNNKISDKTQKGKLNSEEFRLEKTIEYFENDVE